ncbi:MAG: SGNH/GDSL hydrolase family protein [Dysgonamonadaceae bacterium]|jgi:lysophospholipase L1-like esterase|nr:SGNH/GDSL hydrolase family protein [Dysgonamonadaceae bacterium]
MDRRNFIRKSTIVGATALFLPEIVKAAMPESATVAGSEWHYLAKGETVLFQGDSITDSGRSRKDEDTPNHQKQLGGGYPLFTASHILANNPEKELKIYNRGISGNKVFQLAERWEKDCIALKPDVVSILIGVNDFWHTKTGGYTGTITTYIADYNKLIADTLKALPNVKIVILEPFIIQGGNALDNTWESGFAPYRDAAKKVAKDYDLSFVPLQSVFNEALKKAPAAYWGPDGVHPSFAGAQLIAQAWSTCIQ